MIARKGQASNAEVAPAESTEPLPKAIQWNIDNAEGEYRRYLDAGDEAKSLDPKIDKVKDEVADLKAKFEADLAKLTSNLNHLRAHQANLGRSQLEMLDNAKTFHDVVSAWCAANPWAPRPAPFEEFAASVAASIERLQPVATGVRETQQSAAVGVPTDPEGHGV